MEKKDSFHDQVLYETRHHASRPFTSNYPPQKSSERVDGGKGIFSSILSIRGLSQLKERWRDYKGLAKVRKPISLFVSPRGERVAVATRDQITILRKEDDFREPFGVFTNHEVGSFTFGVWCESPDVLGVLDDADTLYFIKANGEEKSRVSLKQLKLASPIIGLIPQDDPDGQGPCGCSFGIVTADARVHYVEISQDPSASISTRHSSNSAFTAKRQFPDNVFCFDYDPKHSLFVAVGSASSTSITSGSNQLSIWRRHGNIDLELLFSVQFDGFYCQPKDYAPQLAYPKVLMSPEANFAATMDQKGCIRIFKLDKENSSSAGLQWIKNLSGGQDDLSSDNMDFTWWSDHILVLVKSSGIVTMIDIRTDLQFRENDHVYSMPLVERVQQFDGQIFILDCRSSEDREISSKGSRESTSLHGQDHVTKERCVPFDVSQLHWSLISISKRSVPEMYNILISKHEYKEALDFADKHGLERDDVLKAQWLCSSHGTNEINMFLSQIKDRNFILSECLDKVGPTEDATKALIACGLHETSRFQFSGIKDDVSSKIWDFRVARLRLLQFRDRLETFMGISMGRFSMQEYRKFRVVPLSEAAIALAESGKIGALNLLFKRHSYSLSPAMLQVLASLPETVPVQTYGQLLPGRTPPINIALREEDWVECKEMLSYISMMPENNEIGIQIRTEPIVKRCQGYVWPSVSELSAWYKDRARDIDCFSGQLDNCLCLVDFGCRKGIIELQQFYEDISYLNQLVYSDENDGEKCFNMSLATWEQLSNYEKFRMILKEVKAENVVKRLHEKAIPFMQKRFQPMKSVSPDKSIDGCSSTDDEMESFLVRWLKEIASENKIEICLMVIEEGCKDLQSNGFFKDEVEVVLCALQCIYLCTVTDRWSTMATILSKLPQKQDVEFFPEILEKRLKLTEGHIEAGRLLAFYQVPKPINFFPEAYNDEKGVKQILRLILSKFVRRQPGRSDNDWANMWRDMQYLREKAFSFLDPEYMLIEFCRGLLKAGKFSLARNYLKGTSAVALAPEKAESLVIQAAREYFFSASSLSCSEIWKAKECLNLFPSSRIVKAEADIIDALTVKLPNLGVNLLPMQFRQIKDPMEIIKMAITGQAGAYLHVDELIEVSKLLGLSSPEDISAVEEAIAREAAVAGDLQLAFDLCLVLVKKGHGLVWDLCAAIARGPALENMDVRSRKQLLGFALSHCDVESIAELLHAWKDLDMQGQFETLITSAGTSPNFSSTGFPMMPLSVHGIQDKVDFRSMSELVEGVNSTDDKAYMSKIKNTLSLVAKNLSVDSGADLDSILRENGKLLSFFAIQLPWLLELRGKAKSSEKLTSDTFTQKQYMSLQTQAMLTILSWLARNGFAPKDDVIASLAKSIMEPPVTEVDDVIGCSFLLNLVDAFNGVEVIEEQLKLRENYQEICSIMNVGMTYSLVHNAGIECKDPAQRRELLLRKFRERQATISSDEMNKIDGVHSTFWRDWKIKLEEKKHVAEQSRVLEQIIPGVETARFLSGEVNYIQSSVLSLIESVKMEKKHIMKDVLKLADAYGLNRVKLLQCYLSSILVSEVWTDEDIRSDISEVKGDIISYASETIKTISMVVYPAIDGCNKHRLAYIYGLLSDCYFRLEETKESMPMIQPCPSGLTRLDLAHLYKVIEQECLRVSFIENLNFKNIAGLSGLNLQSICTEIYRHIDEHSLEALAKMVETFASIYGNSMPEGLPSWQDVYKHYILGLLTNLETRARTEFNIGNPEKFQEFITQLEQTYDFCRPFIKLLAPSDALDIMKNYFTIILTLPGSHGIIPDDSTWQDCLIILLNFWFRLTEEMQEITSNENSVEKLRFDPECLSSCLKVLMKLVMEDAVSPSQGLGTIVGYLSYGFKDDRNVGLLIFCRAMVFAGCGFGVLSEVFSEAISHFATSSTVDGVSYDLPHLYINMLDPILNDLSSGSNELHNLYHLLSSLSKLEGEIDNLQRVRFVVWEKMVQFSHNLQLPSHVRVRALELMQFISGRNSKNFSPELQSNASPWEGWDESLFTGKNSETAENIGLLEHADTSSKLDSTLVALKSSQIAAAISPTTEITPNDLLNVGTAVSCFSKLCKASNTNAHFDALVGILGEWDGFFVPWREKEDSAETSEPGNNWNNDDWDEGWESFQEEEPLEIGKVENSQTHPLHECWLEIFKKLISSSRFDDVLKLIDQSLSKTNGILLDEDSARSLNQAVIEMDFLVALKMSLLLPYEGIRLQCLNVMEDKLKQGGILDTIGEDHEFLVLVLSSGIISTIITNSSYGTIFSYLCYLVGNFSHRCQEMQLSSCTQRGNNERVSSNDSLVFFGKIMLPCVISELVKADQHILAGFIVTKFMHTNASLSLINVSEANLGRYLKTQLNTLHRGEIPSEEIDCCRTLKNTITRLKDKMENLIQSASALLSTNVR